MRKDQRLIKIIAIICFASLAVALLIAYGSPTSGYELSIYDSTPWQVWFLLFLGFVGGISIIVHQLTIARYTDSRKCVIGFSILIFSKTILLLVPYIRGYAGWTGDHLTHLGLIRDIYLSGHFPQGDYYPATHGLMFSLTSITNTSLIAVNLGTTLISVLFILFTYLLATTILPNRRQQVLATLIASAVFLGAGYNIYFMPNGWSIFLLPLGFYLYFKSNILPFRALFILFLMIYPLFHPLSALIIILCITFLELFKRIIPILFSNRLTLATKVNLRPSVAVVILGFVSFLAWVLSFQNFKANIYIMWQQITEGFGTNPIMDIGWSLGKANIYGLDFIALLSKMYGAALLLILLSLIGTFLILRNARSNDLKADDYRFLALASIFLLIGTLYAAYLIGIPGLAALSGERILFYIEILTPALAVPALYMMIRKNNTHHLIRAVAAICIVVLASTTSIISLYPSPLTIQPNLQVTHMDFQGTEWLIEEKNSTIGCAYITNPPSRLADAILGTVEESGGRGFSNNETRLPNHFGYSTNVTFVEQLRSNRYVVVSINDIIIYTGVWNVIGRFSEADFKELQIDNTVSKIYSNTEYDVHIII